MNETKYVGMEDVVIKWNVWWLSEKSVKWNNWYLVCFKTRLVPCVKLVCVSPFRLLVLIFLKKIIIILCIPF